MYQLTYKGIVKEVKFNNMVYLEREGEPASTCPKAWQDFWSQLGPKLDKSTIQTVFAMSKMLPGSSSGNNLLYRAAVNLSVPFTDLPAEYKNEKSFSISNLARWELVGGYEHLAEVYQKIFTELLDKEGIQPRGDFNLETYVNSPENTPKDQLITHIDISV